MNNLKSFKYSILSLIISCKNIKIKRNIRHTLSSDKVRRCLLFDDQVTLAKPALPSINLYFHCG